MTFPALGTDILSKLDSLIESLEVKYALFDMKPWKAPGPDGYPAGFYQQAWDIVGGTMINFVKQVWQNPHAIEEVNHIDICLIPKINQPEYVNQFRPISLCNTM
jgi:hypothetical protein